MSNGTVNKPIDTTAQFETARKAFIAKLTAADKSFTKIFETDKDKIVITDDLLIEDKDGKAVKAREKLKSLQAASKKILGKLQNREFTVAIVGLENSGKSSLGNALIELMALPEYRERCTYTTTEIRASENPTENFAEVHFYTYDEFNNNFRQMLEVAEYPNAQIVDFKKMSLQAFNTHWQSIKQNKPALFDAHDKKTAEDIRIILQNKNTITNLLVGPKMLPFGEQYLNDNNIVNAFKIFITGIINVETIEKYEEVNGQKKKVKIDKITRDSHPYAVKKVVIRSAQFSAMKDIVLYDVPGFNSPTEMHQAQTKKMLQEADAIIFVTNVIENPNLDQAQLTMLSKDENKDTYGIELKKKSFVFGNKIDRANSPIEANSNLETLRTEAVHEKRITREGCVIGGSARAYLESIGLIKIPPPDPNNNLEADRSSKEVLDAWNLSYGVKELRDKIQEYYDHDRFEVLKARAEKILSDMRSILQKLLKEYDAPDTKLDENTRLAMKIAMEKQGYLPKFIEAAHSLTMEHTNKISGERPFTNALREELNNIYPLSATEDIKKIIADVEHKPNINLGGIYQTIRVDERVREKLGVLFLKNIVTSAAKFTDEKQQELRSKLVDKFLEVLGNEKDPNYEFALKKSVNELFDKMLISGCAECNFHSLVERFVMTLIDALITQPFASAERFKYVNGALRELVSLSVYYNMPTDETNQNSLQFENLISDGDIFFARILAHENLPVEETVEDSNEAFLRSFFMDNIRNINKGNNPLVIQDLPLNKWASFIRINDRQNVANGLNQLFNMNYWGNYPAEQKLSRIEQFFNAYAQQNANRPQDAPTNTSTTVSSERVRQTGTLPNFLDAIQRHANSKRMDSKEDMIKLLDEDIEILRDITKKSVLNAIGLERAFNSVIIKNVALICTQLENPENEVCQKWLSNNVEKLVPKQFSAIIAESKLRAKRRAIAGAIKDLLNE